MGVGFILYNIDILYNINPKARCKSIFKKLSSVITVICHQRRCHVHLVIRDL